MKVALKIAPLGKR